MGKFFDALKKAEVSKEQSSATPAAKRVVKISAETEDELKPYTRVVERLTEEPPLSWNGIDPRLACFLRPNSPAMESFRMLRAKLLLRATQSALRTIMVTSAQPLDGKTMVAANLAISIAQGINEHVLLVDCDLRRPSLDRVLGLKAHEGIREYLEKGTSVAPYLMKTPVKKLSLLPAGKVPPNPSELLSSEKMRNLVTELKSRYEDRYIIFDATPAQFAGETTFLVSMVDGALFVVRSGQTAMDQILRAMENIDGSKVIGAVFNASDEAPRDFRYYYRYYQGRRSS